MRKFLIILTIFLACGSSTNTPGAKDVTTHDGHGETTQGGCTTDQDCAHLATTDCEKGVCNASHHCVVQALDQVPCDDHNACTQDDTCRRGLCKGTPVNCPTPKDPCKVSGGCDPEKGCVVQNARDGTPCDDDDPCTVEGTTTCKAGVCQGGKHNPACNCDIDDDCLNNTSLKFDLCKGPVKCVQHECKQDTSQKVTCDQPKEQCKKSVCNPDTGKCEVKNKGDGVACDDGDACTQNDVCKSGKCEGTAKVCDDKNVCTDDGCDPATGKCTHTPVPGRACDDGNVCTAHAGDKCDANGKCQGGAPVFDCCNGDKDCNDNYACTNETCDQDKHQCKYQLKPCSGTPGQCQGSGCLGSQCTTSENWRLTHLITFDFSKAVPGGVRIEPVGAAGVSNGKLSVTQGEKALIHLPLLPGMSMQGMLRIEGSNDVLVQDGQDLGNGFWGIGNDSEHAVVIEVPKGGFITRVDYYGLSEDAQCTGALTITSGKLGDNITVSGGPDGVLMLWVVKGTTKDSLMYQVFDWGGNPVAGDAKKVAQAVSLAKLTVTGLWTGSGWDVLYGSQVETPPKVYKFTVSGDGTLTAPAALGGADAAQQTPFMGKTKNGIVTCYSYKAEAGKDFDVKCRIGDGDYFDLAEDKFSDQAFPQACFMDSGHLVTTWMDYNGWIKARVFSADGQPEGGQATVAGGAGNSVSHYHLFCDPDGFDVVALLDDNTVQAYRYTYENGHFKLQGKAMQVFDATMSMAATEVSGRIMVAGFDCKSQACSLTFHSFKPDLSGDLNWKDTGDFMNIQNQPLSISPLQNGFVGVIVYDQSTLTYRLEGALCDKGWLASGKVCIGDGYY